MYLVTNETRDFAPKLQTRYKKIR